MLLYAHTCKINPNKILLSCRKCFFFMCIEGEWCFGYMKAVSVLSGENTEKSTDLSQVTDTLYHIMLYRVQVYRMNSVSLQLVIAIYSTLVTSFTDNCIILKISFIIIMYWMNGSYVFGHINLERLTNVHIQSFLVFRYSIFSCVNRVEVTSWKPNMNNYVVHSKNICIVTITNIPKIILLYLVCDQ
jgi:hypothetical protein